LPALRSALRLPLDDPRLGALARGVLARDGAEARGVLARDGAEARGALSRGVEARGTLVRLGALRGAADGALGRVCRATVASRVGGVVRRVSSGAKRGTDDQVRRAVVTRSLVGRAVVARSGDGRSCVGRAFQVPLPFGRSAGRVSRVGWLVPG
jgi:hypothetical protein